MVTQFVLYRLLKRTSIVVACIALSGVTHFTGLHRVVFSISEQGALALLILLPWSLAAAAFVVLSASWIFDRKIGRKPALVCCAIGIVGMLAFPMLWLKDFAGILTLELMLTFPLVLLATHMTRFHFISRRVPFNRDSPLGGASRLRSVWRPICGHFDPCLVPDSGAIGSSSVTKLTRNSTRQPPAS